MLDEFELAMTLIRSDEPWPAGALDYSHYLNLHRHLFQDVYEWAGRIRTIRIGKSGNWFCYPEHIDREMRRLFAWLASRRAASATSLDEFRQVVVHLLSELNAIHPFRDGNGRTQMAFVALLTEASGFRFDDGELEPERVMEAIIRSFSGDLHPLEALVADLVRDS